MALCKKFRFAPLDNEEDVEIMFSGASCTNTNAVAPGAREGSAGNDKDNGSDDVQALHPSPAEKQPAKRGAAYKSPKKGKKNFRDMQFKRFVDSFVEKAGSSSATSSPTDHVRQEISEIFNHDEHFYATQLLIKKEFRDVFVTLKTPEGKLAWLNRTWEERKKR
ncbi:hypothetical protein GQ55_4G368100 [Panicum hallii var. hallii]|uniref:Uncharacterized protein n=1 Tax=Panicum hallii var. hallii TaxID=1504633 RepID=A0A2T7E416_9POAL|nr:hypothetical protein GQ55_4G368100 [Panicum hallii var. hallii]